MNVRLFAMYACVFVERMTQSLQTAVTLEIIIPFCNPRRHSKIGSRSYLFY